MQKVVLKLDLHDDKDKKKALKIVSGFAGVDSMSIDMKDMKLTVTGEVDAVVLVGKLRKQFGTADIVSVGPAKDPPKKDDGKKEGDKKKDDNKDKKDGKDQQQPKVDPMFIRGHPAPYYQMPYYPQQPPPQYYYGPMRSVEEDPNGCVIC